MKLLNRAVAFFLLLSLASCGNANALKSGYFVAEGDLATKHYPLVIIQVAKGNSSLYQVSQVSGSGFSSGSSITNESEPSLHTVILHNGEDSRYVGFVNKVGTGLRMRSVHSKKDITDEKDIVASEVEQEYKMTSVSKERAREVLRSLVTIRGAGAFSADQEEDCQGAFGLNCTTVYTK